MTFKELKIGYVPYLPDLSQPGDRRRFPLFAKRQDVEFEIAQFDKKYEIILLTATANLSKWLNYKKRNPGTKFIFELVDSLIFPSVLFDTLFKGVGKFLLHRESELYLNYKNLLVEWIKAADLVICSNYELIKNVQKWNSNVLLTLDYLENEYQHTKTDYSINGKMKLLWEGQGVVLPQFLFFKDLLQEINSFCELHVMTNEEYPRYGNLIHRDVKKLLKKLPIDTVFHKWNLQDNKEIFAQCDCGFIPITSKNKLSWHKPANKLISFWFSGLPTIVSDTPAYKQLMVSAGSLLYCSTKDEWIRKLKWLKNLSDEERKESGLKSLAYAKTNFSNEMIDKMWQQIFEKVS